MLALTAVQNLFGAAVLTFLALWLAAAGLEFLRHRKALRRLRRRMEWDEFMRAELRRRARED